MKTLLNTLRSELSANADPVWKAGAERYFKEPVQFYGMSNSVARKIGSEYYQQLKGLAKDEILVLCEELMKSGLMEETIIACDTLCNHTVAESHRQEVFEFILTHKATMPRTALRYAIEKMPAEMKSAAMKK